MSHRGPVTYDAQGTPERGSGGLVTALTGLATHREVLWIASAMSEHDERVSQEHGGGAFSVRTSAGGQYSLRLVASDPQAYDRFYNVFANPMLWFIQHYLWDLSNAPDIRREEIEAFEFGYNVVNEDLARAVVEELGDDREPVV
ncbi:MAG: trehalose-6-phosphate synthase, partial [Solirubrobacteraceae bacterium]